MAESAIAKACQPVDTNNIMISMDGSTVTAVNSRPPSAPQPLALAPRIYTFGIGPFCNHYFLKRLAAIGRGMNDVAFRPHAIQSVMERMLAAAALPMLSDVQIIVPGLQQVELFPFPIPDVFVGQMLLVSGKFEGDWPETVDISGTLPDGSSKYTCCCTLAILIAVGMVMQSDLVPSSGLGENDHSMMSDLPETVKLSQGSLCCL
eukprot:GHUV01032139.1.p1 GENE.GHUV01032139.1~~GHUV01032139.1.p1  ORF type:complete len:205 (-),score=25.47 GHUV01032139.1:411-1025(-)